MDVKDYNLIHENTGVNIQDLAQIRANMLTSFIYYFKVMFEAVNNRPLFLDDPYGHENHLITIARELRKCFDGKINGLTINIPPRYGKTTVLIYFIAWGLCHSPDGNNMYITYGKELSTQCTSLVKRIITNPIHLQIFPEVQIDPKKTSADDFYTTAGGTVYSTSAGGVITGKGAGLMNCEDRFGGCLVVDDIHKPDDITSERSRESVFEWWDNTLQSRVNSERTPIIVCGQRLHEEDIFYKLRNMKGDTRYQKNQVVLKGITDAGFALAPNIRSLEYLKNLEKDSNYTFCSQYQQEPLPAGGALFKESFFEEIEIPETIISTFITADTAETSKTYNDPTVFSFWGTYNIDQWGTKTDDIGLIWLDCVQIWVEPSDLEQNFLNFYAKCSNFKVKPSLVAIEEKSTGRSLLSFLRQNKGLSIIDVGSDLQGISRTRASGSKSQRFIDIQPDLAKGYVSLPVGGKHNSMVIEHMKRITANNSHKHDDIADTCYDAIKLAIMDKVVVAGKGKTIKEEINYVANYFANYYNDLKSMFTRQ